mmetsp:Transcript_34808/g.104918  ORF Transcript_34808/g.104918 Transcript_34808/m.104918 type:complete len:204 (-) Transcript_34808:94-705(-)
MMALMMARQACARWAGCVTEVYPVSRRLLPAVAAACASRGVPGATTRRYGAHRQLGALAVGPLPMAGRGPVVRRSVSSSSPSELELFAQHGTMLLQTAEIALETRDPDKIRGAKEVASNFIEAYVGVCRAAAPGSRREAAEAQLADLRRALRDLILAERGRFEVGALGQGNNAADNIADPFNDFKVVKKGNCKVRGQEDGESS